MATTTNYGWTTPDDTALVKDGAAAIRSLGTAIDTTTKNLNPSTTLGDIEYRSSTANTNTRLGIGSAGQVLTVSSGVPAWTTISSGGLTLLSTTTLSSTTTNIGSIDQTYTNLLVIFSNITYSVAGTPYLRFNDNSGDVYDWGRLQAGATSQSTNNTTQPIYSTNANASTTDSINSGSLLIYGYASTTYVKPYELNARNISSGNARQMVAYWGSFIDNGAISSIKFYANGGNFNGGTVRIYGVK